MADAGLNEPEVAQARDDLFDELSRLKERERENRNHEEQGQPCVPMDYRRLGEYAAAYVAALPTELRDSACKLVVDFDEGLKRETQPGSKLAESARESVDWLESLKGAITDQPHLAQAASRLARKGRLITAGKCIPSWRDGSDRGELQSIPIQFEDFEEMQRDLKRLVNHENAGGSVSLKRWLKEVDRVLGANCKESKRVEAIRFLLNGGTDFVLWIEQTEKSARGDHLEKLGLGVRLVESLLKQVPLLVRFRDMTGDWTALRKRYVFSELWHGLTGTPRDDKNAYQAMKADYAAQCPEDKVETPKRPFVDARREKTKKHPEWNNDVHRLTEMLKSDHLTLGESTVGVGWGGQKK
jgi:hypothetical protein